MDDDEVEAGTSSFNTAVPPPPPSLFKKRSKPRAAGGVIASSSTASSPVTQSSIRKSQLQSNEEEADDGDEDVNGGVVAAVVRTTSGRGRARGTQAITDRKKSSVLRVNTAASSLANSEDEVDEGPAFALRKDAIARSYAAASANEDDALLASLQQQASIRDNGSAQSAYSPAALAELKASTSSLSRNGHRSTSDEASMQTAHKHMIDPSTQTDESGDSLTRMKFAADFAHDGIPSEAVINAAKERRRRAMAVDAEGLPSSSEDYISLRGTNRQDDGPHPESRLQREEDEEGSGEDDFADFTGATERIALEKQGIDQEKARERERRREEMDVDEGESSNDSEREWERAQMDRVQGASIYGSARRKHREKRDVSPFRAEAIPQAIPLPTLSATSDRLRQRKLELEEAIHAQEQLQKDATSKLDQLHNDEERNKTQTESAAEREAWFREFTQFIQSMAQFLEEKLPRLQDIEETWTGHLSNRTRKVQRARADAMADHLSLFYGVPARSLEVGHKQDDGVVDFQQSEVSRLPLEDGDALSDVRTARRPYVASALAGELAPTDQTNFTAAQAEIVRRAKYLLDDVQAAEYREPAPRISRHLNGDDAQSGATTLHPASLVARFHRWRRMFPDDYHNAWGGLTLASVWEFWIRRSLCGWDAFRVGTRQPRDLDGFAWYVELAHYADKASTQDRQQNDHNNNDSNEDEMDEQNALGGDDEVLAHALTNTVIPTMIKLCEHGAFDPWSASDHASALDVVEQMSYVLERDNARFQSLVSAFLRTFEPHITVLVDSLTLPPALAAPAMSPDAPPALLAFAQFVAGGLVRHLIAWHRFVLAAQRPFLLELVHTLMDKAVVPLLDMTQHTVGGADLASSLASDILTRTARPALLGDAVREQLQRFVR